MAKFDLKEYARRGAEARVAELRAELAEIYRTFPGLRRTGTSAAAGEDAHAAGNGPRQARKTGGRRARRRQPMSDAQKREVSLRMKKYWAEQRKAKSAKTAAKSTAK